MAIALLIADDHPFIRSALRATFQLSGIEVVDEAGTTSEAFQKACDPRAQVMLLDINWLNRDESMTLENGVDLLARIQATRPELAVVMYSQEDDPSCIDRCRRLGARGYLVKGIDDALLTMAVRAVHAGEQIWPGTRVPKRPWQRFGTGSEAGREEWARDVTTD